MNKKIFMLSAFAFLGSCKGNYFNLKDKGAGQSTPAEGASGAAAVASSNTSRAITTNGLNYDEVKHIVSDEEVMKNIRNTINSLVSDGYEMSVEKYRRFLSEKTGSDIRDDRELIKIFKNEYYTVKETVREEVTVENPEARNEEERFIKIKKIVGVRLKPLSGIDFEAIEKACRWDDLVAFVCLVMKGETGDKEDKILNLVLSFKDTFPIPGSSSALDMAFDHKAKDIIEYLCSFRGADNNYSYVSDAMNQETLSDYLSTSPQLERYFKESDSRKSIEIKVRNPISLLSSLINIKESEFREWIDKINRRDVDRETIYSSIEKRNRDIYDQIMKIPNVLSLCNKHYLVGEGEVLKIIEKGRGVDSVAAVLTPRKAQKIKNSGQGVRSLVKSSLQSIKDLKREKEIKEEELCIISPFIDNALGKEFMINLNRVLASELNKEKGNQIFAYFLTGFIKKEDNALEAASALRLFFDSKSKGVLDKKFNDLKGFFRCSDLSKIEQSFEMRFGISSEDFLNKFYSPLFSVKPVNVMIVIEKFGFIVSHKIRELDSIMFDKIKKDILALDERYEVEEEEKLSKYYDKNILLSDKIESVIKMLNRKLYLEADIQNQKDKIYEMEKSIQILQGE